MAGSLIARMRRNLGADERGNTALIVALAMGPICIASLGAIDLARATSARSQLQDALDMAALGAARTSGSDADYQAAGERILRQNLALDSDFQLRSSSFTLSDDNRVQATAEITVVPFIAGLVTGGPMTVKAASEVVRAGAKVEIALVLDNTGSMMQGSKLADLKDAASDFVTQMENISKKSVEADSVRISLVPFSNTVRVDEDAYRHAAWIDQNGASPINDQIFTTEDGTQHANRFELFDKLGVKWRGCVEMREAPYDVQDDPPTSGATLYTPYFAVDEPDDRTRHYDDDYDNSYVDDGTESKNWRVRQGSVTKYVATRGLGRTGGPNKGCGLSRMIRLSTDFSALRTAIRNMNAVGNTNIPIGLAWGWNTLSPYAPFSDGVTYGTPKYKKIVVLMTDGENVMDSNDTPNDGTYAGAGYVWQGRVLKADGTKLKVGDSEAERTAALDSRLSLLCENIKKKDIEIYTIRVQVKTGSSALLKGCATAPDDYYDVTESGDLTKVFQNIAGQIAALHLSR